MFLILSILKAITAARLESVGRMTQAGLPRVTAARSSRP